MSEEPRQTKGRVLVDSKLVEAPSLIAGCPKAALLFWFFGGLRCVLSYRSSVRYKNRTLVKLMFNVRLAGDHLYGKLLFTWLSLMVSYFVLSFFSRNVLDEMWDGFESVPETFPTCSI